MDKKIIAVGSKRGPKLDAIHEALDTFAQRLAPDVQFEVIGFDVESGVAHTPLSSAESMRGARQRAEALVRMAAAKRESYLYYVGLEGGLDVIGGNGSPIGASELASGNPERRVFLESWAYVTDGSRGYFGRSGAVELPEALAVEVVDKQVELAEAIDHFAGKSGIRDGGGAWGILSGGLITRREAFRLALIAAFAPFYNANSYQAARAAH
jgi:non-canonical (house-cleaning) NTP pyrophosphatase